MAEVFISHSHRATKDAALLAHALQQKGVSAWTAGKNLSGLPPGSDWKAAIQAALEGADAVVFLVIPKWKPSAWIQEEYMKALESYWSGKTRLLVPLLVGANAEPTGFLRQWKSLKVENKGDWDRCAVQLVKWLSNGQQVRSEPSEEAKLERNERLEALTKFLHEKQSSPPVRSPSSHPKNGTSSGHNLGENKQVGRKKGRSSKTTKR